MKRPKQHLLETESITYVQTVLPTRWIVRRQDPDYGIDLTVQIVTEEGEVTGDYLNLQVKSTGRPVKKKGNSLKWVIETRLLKHLMELWLPAIVVVYDAANKRANWLYIQKYVYEEFTPQNPRWETKKKVTILIPNDQVLSRCEGDFAKIARNGPLYLARKALEAPEEWARRFELSDSKQDIKVILDDLSREKSESYLKILYVSDIDIRTGTSQQVCDELCSVVQETRDKDLRVFAESAHRLTEYCNPWDKEGNATILRLGLDGIKASREIGDRRLEASFLAITGEAYYIGQLSRARSIMLAKKVNDVQGFTMENQFLDRALSDVNKRMTDVGNYLFEALNIAAEIGDINLLAKIHLRFLSTQIALYSSFVPYASRTELVATEETIRRLIHQLGEMESKGPASAILAEAYHKKGMFLYLVGEYEAAVEAFAIAGKHAAEAGLDGLVSRMQDQLKMMRDRPSPKSSTDNGIASPELEFEVVSRLLDAWGVDLGTNDLVAWAVKIGLRDMNPERVLKWCKHLYVEAISQSHVGQLLMLPIGKKVLYCEFGGAVFDDELDRALSTFRERYCRDCLNRSPLPDDWKWTREWSQNRDMSEGMKKAIDNFTKL